MITIKIKDVDKNVCPTGVYTATGETAIEALKRIFEDTYDNYELFNALHCKPFRIPWRKENFFCDLSMFHYYFAKYKFPKNWIFWALNPDNRKP